MLLFEPETVKHQVDPVGERPAGVRARVLPLVLLILLNEIEDIDFYNQEPIPRFHSSTP